MKRVMKKTLVLMTFLLAFGTMWGQTTLFWVDSIQYMTTSDNTASIRGAKKDITNAVIPEEVTNEGTTFSVTTIGDRAFQDCEGLISVTIPNTVTTIGERAFCDCESLVSVTIPNGVTTIGNYAFMRCDGMVSLTIGNSVTTIGKGAFYGCGILTSVTIPNGVTKIEDETFAYCDILESVTIPNSVTTIGKNAFLGCDGLICLTIPSSVTTIGEKAFDWCGGLKYVICLAEEPPAFTGNNIFEDKQTNRILKVACDVVEDYQNSDWANYFSKITCEDEDLIMFWVDSLQYGIISDNTVEVWGRKSGITNAVIPETVTYKNKTYNVTSIGANAFYGCGSLVLITMPNSVTSIGKNAFHKCTGLITVEIPESVTTIGESAFSNCSGLITVEIPESVTTIGEYAFSYCSGLTTVTIPDNVTKIRASAFGNCTSLTSVTIGSGLDTIEVCVFEGCTSLASITIPDGIASIGSGTFNNCSSLALVTIGSGVTSIASNAFSNCSGLEEVACRGEKPPVLGSSVFYGTPTDKKLKVPCSAEEQYKNSDWKLRFKNITCYDPSSLSDVAGQGVEIVVCPNPITTQGNAVINLQGLNGNAKLMVMDAQGRILINEDLVSGAETYEIKTSGLGAGVYYLSIRTQNGVATEKLIVK